ncbi:DUF2206 domain-containing protein [Candidatus Bathyarchaeota archaeon]|nr:DUF2206 domain-containing protein [Candidatus Bathyarchaeota archaeon]
MKDSVFLLLVYVAFLSSIVFNIPVLRITFGFVCLTFVPGFLFVRILKLENDRIDTVLFSVGLSIAFLMIGGLLMCVLFPMFDSPRPLSTLPLIAVLGSITLGLVLVDRARGSERSFVSSIGFERGTITVLLRTALLFLIPLLAIIGAIYDNVIVLLLMLAVVAVLYGLSSCSRIVPPRFHLLVIFLVSLALVFHTSLISRYLMGWDIQLENYVFKTTEILGTWSLPSYSVSSDTARFGSTLSITVLPTVYSELLGTSSEVLFKIIYPLIFSIVPLVLYRIYSTQMSKTTALLGVLFFVSTPYSFFGVEPLGLARQIIAELFFVLSIYLLVENRMPIQKKWFLFLVFGIGLIVSHYALSYFYVALLILTFLVMRKWRSRELLSISIVLLIFALTFSWNLYVSDAPLMKLSEDLVRMYTNFTRDLLNVQSRAPQLSTLSSPAPSIVSMVHRVVFYAQNLFIVAGVALLALKRTEPIINPTYRWMSIMNLLVLVLCFVIPNLALSFQLTRFYAITIIFLAPFFVIGGQGIVDLTVGILQWFTGKLFHTSLHIPHRKLALGVVSIVLVISFLFSVGFIDHITGNYPDSVALDKEARRSSPDLNERIGYYFVYIPSQDVSSAIWLSEHMTKSALVYADSDSRYSALLSYGLIALNQSDDLLAYFTTGVSGYAYLRSLNVIEGILVNPTPSNLSEISSALDPSNKIYCNGASEIFLPPS